MQKAQPFLKFYFVPAFMTKKASSRYPISNNVFAASNKQKMSSFLECQLSTCLRYLLGMCVKLGQRINERNTKTFWYKKNVALRVLGIL